MLHAHNFTTYIKKETGEYLIFILLTLTSALVVFRMFPYDTAAFFNSLGFSSLILILFFKSVARRIFYSHIYNESEYKLTESITSIFIFSVMVSLLVFIFLFFCGLVFRIFHFSEFHQSAIVYFSLFICFVLPTLMTEMIFASRKNSGLISIFRYATVIMFISSLVFPLIYHPDLILILQFFALTAVIRFFIFLMLLFDFQYIDFFSVTLIRLRKYLHLFFDCISFDLLFWLMIPIFYFVIYFQLDPEYDVIWTVGFLVFIAIPMTMGQTLDQWSLIFKNFIRLDLTNEYMNYAQHINVWQCVLFFAAAPFLLLIFVPLISWEMTSLPDTVSVQYLITAMIFSSISGYFFSNPLKEILVYFGRKKELNSIILSSAAGIIISSFFFYNMIGFWGFYFSMLLGGFIYWIGINIVLQPLLGCEFKHIFPYKKLTKILLAGLLASASAYSVSLIPNIIFKESGWTVFAYYSTYSLMIIYFGVLKSENGNGFKNWSIRLGNLH